MHRLFVPPEQIAELVRLDPAQSRHLEVVLRLGPGAQLEVFDGRGAHWPARIESPGVLRLGPRADPERGAADVWLAQALARGEKLDLVVQKATELGATRILPLAAERSAVRLDEDRAERRTVRLRRIAQEAARQCGRSDVPAVDAPQTLADLAGLLRAEPERLRAGRAGSPRAPHRDRGPRRPRHRATPRRRARMTGHGFVGWLQWARACSRQYSVSRP